MQTYVELNTVGVKQLNKFLNTWLSAHEFECTVEFDNDFSFDSVNDIIHYSFVLCDLHDSLFKEVCVECNGGVADCGNFVLSFFHELGHFNTLHIFTDSEWERYENQRTAIEKSLIGNKDENTEKILYKQYYKNPIELEATQWGCDYIVSHYDEVQEFNKNFQDIYIKFLNENGVGYDIID